VSTEDYDGVEQLARTTQFPPGVSPLGWLTDRWHSPCLRDSEMEVREQILEWGQPERLGEFKTAETVTLSPPDFEDGLRRSLDFDALLKVDFVLRQCMMGARNDHHREAFFRLWFAVMVRQCGRPHLAASKRSFERTASGSLASEGCSGGRYEMTAMIINMRMEWRYSFYLMELLMSVEAGSFLLFGHWRRDAILCTMHDFGSCPRPLSADSPVFFDHDREVELILNSFVEPASVYVAKSLRRLLKAGLIVEETADITDGRDFVPASSPLVPIGYHAF
jgi:hypothetical protein